jgi:hypothetical protein
MEQEELLIKMRVLLKVIKMNMILKNNQEKV